MSEETKVCQGAGRLKGCGLEKPRDEFYATGAVCIECMKIDNKIDWDWGRAIKEDLRRFPPKKKVTLDELADRLWIVS